MYNVLDISRYIIDYSHQKEGYGISNLKLQKLLYFVQAYFLATKKEKCFPERIVAWDIGPINLETYREYKKYGSCSIPNISNDEERPYINDFDKKLIEAVVDIFAEWSAPDMTKLSQDQKPWYDYYMPGKENVIPAEAIKEYFEDED